MENATKALLIAAAILIAILIISMGIVVYRNSAEQVNNADLSSVEVTSFNSKFEQYAGTQSAENVKALAKLIVNNNVNSNTKQKVGLIVGGGTTRYIEDTRTSLPNDLDEKIISGKTYNVELWYKDSTGLIYTVKVTEKTT